MSVNPPLQIPENHSQEVLFYHIPHLPQPPNPSFASQRPLLAVIFRCNITPDSKTGFEPGISQNISAVFSRMRAVLGSGPLPGKIVSDGEASMLIEHRIVNKTSCVRLKNNKILKNRPP